MIFRVDNELLLELLLLEHKFPSIVMGNFAVNVKVVYSIGMIVCMWTQKPTRTEKLTINN